MEQEGTEHEIRIDSLALYGSLCALKTPASIQPQQVS